MDLKGMLNDGPATQHANTSSPDVQQERVFQPAPPPPPPATPGQPVHPPSYPYPPNQQTPLYPPAAASPIRQAQAYPSNRTPLRTSSQGPAPVSGQYPFPQHPAQSPAAALPQQRSYEPQGSPASTPFPRPASHAQQHYPLPNALQSHTPTLQRHTTASMSPTPSSTNSPFAPRPSPMSGRGQPLNHQLPPQHAQPSTPLAPPPLYRQPSGMQDTQTPLHQRSYSGASNGVASVSPAANVPGNPQYFDSPSAYNRPTSQHRQSSGYTSRASRERSESVSPKTKVPPRLASLGSRQSSEYDVHSRPASIATNMNSVAAEPPRHVMPNTPHVQHQYHPQQQQQHHAAVAQQSSFDAHPNAASEVSQSTAASQAASQAALGFASAPESSFPQHQRPPIITHQGSKMGMTHLLTSANDVSPVANGPTQQPAPPSLKRPADCEIAPPSKQPRMRKHTERPIWATLSEHNPRFRKSSQNEKAPSATHARHPGQPNGKKAHHANAPTSDTSKWTQEPPLDNDLIHSRQVLGPWEKTYKWNTPYPDILKAVQDWLYQELEQLGDVGRNPHEGTIEIEAKFGSLTYDGEEYKLPVLNACVIDPGMNGRLHFASSMSVHEHKFMNSHLNDAIHASMQPGRTNMSYLHTLETDSFYALSAYGQSILPQSVQRRQNSNRHPRLRVTRSRDKVSGEIGPIIARIVKIPISNLHIFNPGYNYDCRISINLEVNLNRPDLRLEELIDRDPKQGREVDRNKDRIAYKHLAYSIDLTKVERQGLEASHELELEVDSNLLREQITLLQDEQANAFGDVVEGFLNNATFLMRTRPPLG